MRIPEALREAAIAAFEHGVNWATFMQDHAADLRQAVPYDRAKYQRMWEAVRSIVVSGTTDGLYPPGDDAACPWEADDAAAQVDDVRTNAKYRGPLPLTQSTAFDVTEAYE